VPRRCWGKVLFAGLSRIRRRGAIGLLMGTPLNAKNGSCPSCCLRSEHRPIPEQRQHFVTKAHEIPFRLHCLQSPKRESAKALRGFDLPIHRLHDRLTSRIYPPLFSGVESPAHSLSRIESPSGGDRVGESCRSGSSSLSL